VVCGPERTRFTPAVNGGILSLKEDSGLNEREVNWVRNAKADNEADGYSEALLGLDGDGWFPLRVRASEYEAEMVD